MHFVSPEVELFRASGGYTIVSSPGRITYCNGRPGLTTNASVHFSPQLLSTKRRACRRGKQTETIPKGSSYCVEELHGQVIVHTQLGQ
jgi:hypothetical protein